MSAAIVCGKRSFFEDIESSSPGNNSNSPSPVYKKFRCSSPVRFNYSPPVQQQRSLFDQLLGLFPDMETQILEKALGESGYDLDSAIKKLEGLRLNNAKYNSGSTAEETAHVEEGATQTGVNVLPLEEPPQNNLPVNGAEWVDLFVKQMMSATSIDDAKSRAANILENLEKSITALASETTQNYHKENVMLREQIGILLKESAILKRAVAIQHERQKEFDEKNQEGHHLKQMVAQYQEQIRNLEINNYALSMHLRQAQQNDTIPGHFHPDIFQ